MTRVGEKPPHSPKRFYDRVECVEEDAGFAIRLDGRMAKTRSGKPLCVESLPFGRAVADEWDARKDVIDLTSMPMTRFAMALIDLGARDKGAWRDVILSFLSSDLVCYRAAAPAALVERQTTAWDPLLEWARSELSVELKTSEGVVFVDQSPEARNAAGKIIDAESPARTLGVKAAAEIAGSAVIALALMKGAFPAEQLFAASRVDEDFQAERWGLDQEAQARAKRLERDFFDVARFFSLI